MSGERVLKDAGAWRLVLACWFSICWICSLDGKSLGEVKSEQAQAIRKRHPISREAFDAGDFYISKRGKKRFQRLIGPLAVQVNPVVAETELHSKLTTSGSILQGWKVTRKGRNLMVCEPPDNEGAALAAINELRNTPGIIHATPLLLDESNLVRVPTFEMIVCLEKGVAAENVLPAVGVRKLRGANNYFVVRTAAKTVEELWDAIAEYNQKAGVAWAEPNFASEVKKQTTDSLFARQWHLNNLGGNGSLAGADINAPEAWAHTAGNSNVVIAIVDDGVQLSHPDLSANIFINADPVNGRDDDGNGYIDDTKGWDFYDDDRDANHAYSDDYHGTSTAAVAAERANNSLGGAGGAYGCRILPIKIVGGVDYVFDDVLAEALYYAAGSSGDGQRTWRGADIISISLGFAPAGVIDDALQWASQNGRNGRGCAVFASVGNSATRWLSTRILVPVGARVGSGPVFFGFEYAKDGTVNEGEDLVKIDNVALLAADGVTVLNSSLGVNGRQDFEGAFPPQGWWMDSSPGSAKWGPSTQSALKGTGGTRSPRSGVVLPNGWTELLTPTINLNGTEILSFSVYLSSEYFDGLNIWVYDNFGHVVYIFGGDLPYLSGNEDLESGLAYPASHPSVISVGASTDRDLRADYSQTGQGLDFLAPSSGGWRDIVTADITGANGFGPGDYLVDFGGTSAACPLAASVAGLILSANPTLTSVEVRDIMRATCARVGPLPYDSSGWNESYGHGRINAQRAVSNALANLSMTVAKSPDPWPFGSAYDYAIVVSNAGPSAASDVRLTNRFNRPVTLISAGPGEYSALNSTTVVFQLGGIPAGNTRTGILQIMPSSSGRLTNSLALSSLALDSTPLNDRSNAVTFINNPATVSITSPADGAVIFAPTNLLISATASDLDGPVSRVEFYANGVKLGQDATPSFAFTWSNAPVGAHILRADVVDGVGAVTTSAERHIQVMPLLSAADVSVTEALTNVAFQVRLSAPAPDPVTFYGVINGGTAEAGIDFISLAGTITLAPGVTSTNLRIPILDDDLSESNETFFLLLSNPVNAGISDTQAVATIIDNNDPRPDISIFDRSVIEGNSGTNPVELLVQLSRPSGRRVTVLYAITNGTATAPTDFPGKSGSFIFPPGLQNLPVPLSVIGDTSVEYNETIRINLSAPVNATLTDTQAVITILDDDLRITSLKQSGSNALISFTSRSGRTNRVEYKELFSPGTSAWVSTTGLLNIVGSGGIMTATNRSGFTGSNRFYRVRMLP